MFTVHGVSHCFTYEPAGIASGCNAYHEYSQHIQRETETETERESARGTREWRVRLLSLHEFELGIGAATQQELKFTTEEGTQALLSFNTGWLDTLDHDSDCTSREMKRWGEKGRLWAHRLKRVTFDPRVRHPG